MIYCIAQTIGISAFIISLIAYHRDKKEKILSSMIISNILNLLHYILLGAFSGCITKIISIFRDIIIINKRKNKILSSKIILLIFLIIYILAGILTYNDIWSIFPIIAAIIYLIPTWNGNKLTVKKAAFLCYFFWLIYNIFVFSIAGIISNIISIISTFIAIKNNNK